jgi:formylglycine-generating enzyme required for sulfatase activity
MENSLASLLERLEQLTGQWPELRDGVRKAVLVAEFDAEMALTRSRKVLEWMIREVYQRRVDEPPGSRPLENLLQRLVKDGHLPTRLEAYANTVRMLGNLGTHRFGETVGTGDVYQSLCQLTPILEWYVREERPEADVVGCGEPPAAVAPDLPARLATAARPATGIAIVPKGLRTFDAGDANFFLDLLPGPRDQSGLPDSLRFWKQRIEDQHEIAFAVGVLYGPSGCGKSSLVKAGLLPRLDGRILPVYVEATAHDTEARLLNVLHRRCPGLPGDLDLAGALAALRQGHGLGPAQKVFLVLDQFEQWLHAWRQGEDAGLIQALRQCDGERVQALIMIRDDFWLALSRFMAEVHIELLQGQNLALVDLFDPGHARRILSAFGRAFGRVAGELSTEQEAFLVQAVDGLAEQRRVVPVRLALFAEMVKDKPWTPATLKALGGAEGVGVAFLEETFSAATASPRNRLHQQAVRAVLKALLPEQGTDIKGAMRSYDQLLAASGYAGRPKDFDELLRILDTEVRLITPTEAAEPADSDAVGPPQSRGASRKCYQLTHDYLVPSLRQWMARKQRGTRRGRAELRLSERAVFWSVKPQPRHLPGWWEWLSIRLFTRRQDWTPGQSKMMRKADAHHLLRGLAWTAMLAVVVSTILTIRGQVIQQNQAAHAAGLVQRLLDANIEQVPAIIGELAPYRRWTDPLLAAASADAERTGSRSRQLDASLALLPVDPGQVEYLYRRLLDADPQEAAILIQQLAGHRGELVPRLWAVVDQPPRDREGQRLRAAAALAAYDPDSPRWDRAAGPVAEQLVALDPMFLGSLRPARSKLLRPLAAVVRETSEDRTTVRMLASNILADYAADRPALLVSLIRDADEKQFAVLFPKLSARSAEALPLLQQALQSDSDGTKTDHDPEARAKRQANAAIALLRLGRPEFAWQLLRHRPDPRARSYLIHRLGTLRADPQVIIEQWGREREVSTRRALLLSLSQFGLDRLSQAQRELLVPSLAKLYREDPDPGLHAALEWLLRQWKQDRLLPPLSEPQPGDEKRRARAERLQQVRRQWAKDPQAAEPRWYVNHQGQTMVLIPGPVEALVGSPPTELGREGGSEGQTEAPQRKRIGRAFAMAAKEVTVAQFLRFRPDHRYNKQFARSADCPVTGVTWYDAAAYCNWLTSQDQLGDDQQCYLPNAAGKFAEGMKMAPDCLRRGGYRLPTEAEWEYACRAGSATARYYGETAELLGEYAWYTGNSRDRWLLPVGSLKPNDLGLFDMLGNAMEWTQGANRRPAPAANAACSEDALDAGDLAQIDDTIGRVSRGCSFLSYALNVRSAYRNWGRPSYVSLVIGLRPARTLP